MNLTQRQRIVLLGVLEDQQSLASMATDVGSRLDRGRQRITVRNAQNGLVPMNLPGWLGRAPTNSDHVLFHREYLRLEDMGLIQRVSLTGGRRTKGIGRLVRAAGDRDDGPLADELRELNDEYTDVETQVQQIEAQFDQQEDVPTERDVAEALRTVEPLWAELFPAEKERIGRASCRERV